MNTTAVKIRKSVEVEFLFEFINASARIDKLLFAGEEGVAFSAYINLYGIFAGICFIFFAASASDNCFLEFRMDSGFHLRFPSLSCTYNILFTQRIVYHTIFYIASVFFDFFKIF